MRREVKIECHETAGGSPGRLVGVLLPIGRVAGDRREVFTPGAVSWPHNGMRLLLEHRGRQAMRFAPEASGAELRIDTELPDTAEGREAAELVRSGQRSALSIEFHAVDEGIVQGVCEVRAAIVDAAALVPSGAYDQARAEVRQRREVRLWL